MNWLKHFQFSSRTESTNAVFLIGCMIVVASLPFSRPVNSAGIILMGLAWLLSANFKAKWNLIKASRLMWLFVAYFLLNVLSLAWTNNLDLGIEQVGRRVSLLLMPVFLLTFTGLKPTQGLIILKTFVLAVLVAGLYCHVDGLMRLAEDSRPASAFFGGWYTYAFLVAPISINPTYFAMYVVLALGMLVYLFLKDPQWKGPKMRIPAIAMGAYLVFFLIHLGARMGILAFMILGAVGFTIWQRRLGNHKLLAIGLFGMLAFASIAIFGFERNRQRFTKLIYGDERLADESELRKRDSRLVIWSEAIQLSKENPFAGVGVGDVQQALKERYQAIGFQKGLDEQLNTHNQFLDALIALGLIGPLVLLLSLLAPMRSAWKTDSWLYVWFLGTVLFMAVTENILDAQKGIVCYAFFNALLAFRFQTKLPSGTGGYSSS